MTSETSLDSCVQYGKALASSGVSGLLRGKDSYLNGKPLPGVLRESARASMTLATLGLGAGLLQLYFGARRRRIPKSVAAGAIGAGIAFVAAFTWKTRELAGSMAQGAARSMGAVRDEHWLERHPIDYA